MELNLTTATGKSSSKGLEVSDAIFGREFNEGLVHQVVTAYLAGGRAGTKAQKTRSQVRGGGAKPFAQKGTGRARAGTIRSPLWRSGGTIFAATPRDYSQKVNRSMYRGAMRSILSELVRQERLITVDKFELEAPRTKALVERLQKLGAEDVLIITEDVDKNLYLSARNLSKVNVCDVAAMNPVSLVGYGKVIITADAIKKIEERLS